MHIKYFYQKIALEYAKIYTRKESIGLYLFLGLLILSLFFTGVFLVNRFYWILLLGLVFVGSKIFTLRKNGESPVIGLSDEGITFFTPLRKVFLPYSKIDEFELHPSKSMAYYRKTPNKRKTPVFLKGMPRGLQEEMVEIIHRHLDTKT